MMERIWIAENDTFNRDIGQKTRHSDPTFLAWNYFGTKQESQMIASKAEPQKVKLTGAEQYCSERNNAVLIRLEPQTRRTAEKSQKGAEREFVAIPTLDSTQSRIAAPRIAQNSTGPVESACRRAGRGRVGTARHCLYQIG